MEPGSRFRILAVCTGNVCRSPMVERILQDGFERISPGNFEVSSAGTRALVGRDMTPQVRGLVRVFGSNDAGFQSRQLTSNVLQGQDLVLALTRQHRSAVLELAPALLRRTFTLREFARMVECVSAKHMRSRSISMTASQRWEVLLPLAAATRHAVMGSPNDDDVVDPYRRDDDVYQQMVRQIAPAVDVLLDYEGTAIRAQEIVDDFEGSSPTGE